MSLIPVDTSLVLDTRRVNSYFAVVEHLAAMSPGQPPQIIYVGCERLVDVYKMINARQNTEWARIYQSGGSVMVRIIALADERAEATRYAILHIRAMEAMPRCNNIGSTIRMIGRPVTCSNGETYTSQKHAADVLGLSQSSVSRHMRGDLSHVRGYTFKYAG